MDENKSKRKDIIKTIAIIFLAAMLVLTFFSNTIMNYSLPEVSAVYVSQGTISEQIRGSGTVTVQQEYEVVLDQTREIKSVLVKEGNTVSAGDTLFELEDEESEELEEAKSTLTTLELEYNKALIEYSAQQGYSAELAEISDAEETLEKLKERYEAALAGTDDLSVSTAAYKAAKKDVDALTAEQTKISEALSAVDTDDMLDLTGDYYTRLRTAKDNLTAAQSAYDTAQDDYDDVLDEYSSQTDYSDEITAKRREIETLQNKINQYYIEMFNLDPTEDTSSLNAAINEENLNLKYLKQDLSTLTQKASSSSMAKLKIQLAEEKVTKTKKALNAAKETLTEETRSVKLSLRDELNDVEEKLYAANEALSEAEEAKSDATAAGGLSASELSVKIEEQEAAIRDLQTALETKQLTDSTSAQTVKLDLDNMEQSIEAQKEKIEKLEAETIDAVVTAKVGGLIKSVSVTAGESTTAGSAVMVISMVDKGYTLSFSVKTEQAKKVSIGDKAEITNWYWGDDLQATLVAINPDSSDPQSSRILEFRITGSDITEGQSLSLSMGSKGQQYAVAIPNSAVREDSNGKFVLAMEAKSSPLGNRYVAVRYDVEVIAKDDNNSAVNGLLGSEFIIITSTTPIEAGNQVRPAN